MVLAAALAVWLTISIMQECGMNVREKLSEQNLVFRWSIYIIALVTVLIFGVYGSGYDASSFIYRTF